jgi:uncharacterized membrane protein YbhN (UPF0104 family)
VSDAPAIPARTADKRRRWRAVLLVVVVVGALGLLAAVARSTLRESVASLAHLDWIWLALAVGAEAGSMAAFARTQRRLLRAGGTNVHLGSVMAVTYAGNALSVSLPLAGSEVATAYSFRQFSRRGIDPAVVGWALAVSGIISSFAFSVVVAAGALASGSATAAVLGLAGAVVLVLPGLGLAAALRYAGARRVISRLLVKALTVSRRLCGRPGLGAEDALERFLDRLAGLHLPRLQWKSSPSRSGTGSPTAFAWPLPSEPPAAPYPGTRSSSFTGPA